MRFKCKSCFWFAVCKSRFGVNNRSYACALPQSAYLPRATFGKSSPPKNYEPERSLAELEKTIRQRLKQRETEISDRSKQLVTSHIVTLSRRSGLSLRIIGCVLLLLLLPPPSFGQTVFNTQKAAWLARGGKFLDSVTNDASLAFATLESGTVGANQPWFSDYIARLMNDESWWSGNRGSGPVALGMCLLYKDRLPTGDYAKMWARLNDLVGDDYYWAQIANNGQINCMAVKYLMSQFNRSKQVLFDYIPDDPAKPAGGDFTGFDGVKYQRGKKYNTYELTRAWFYWWMERYISGGYIHGELFSEVYGHHFLVALVMLADARLNQDATMRQRAAMAADFMLFEYGINANNHHLAAPLGRTYMMNHITGQDNFWPFAPYFGYMQPTHYGNSSVYFCLDYRLPEDLRQLCAMPAGSGFREIFSSVQGGRYVYATNTFTLGSDPGQSWMLEINSNDPGPFPQSRPGMGFRLWLNNNRNDLDPASCSGECYAEMGMMGFHYRDAVFVALSGGVLHEALTRNKWDSVEGNYNNGWRFSVENNVAVGIRIEADAAAVEVSRLGVDEADLAAFKTAVQGKAKIAGNTYTTRRGDKIENRNDLVFVNGKAFAQNMPRMRVVDGSGNELAATTSAGVFRLGSAVYDFKAWTDNTPAPRLPAAPRALVVGR